MALKPARLQWSEDGSVVSLDYGDVYFQRGKGQAESDYVFLRGNNLASRFGNLGEKTFVIGETGFGTGLNFLLTLDLFEKTAPPGARLVYISFEKHPIAPDDLARILSMLDVAETPAARQLLNQYPPAIAGHHSLLFAGGRVRLQLVLGDVRATLAGCRFMADAWFLDGFTPWRNPDAWEAGTLALIGAKTVAGGTLASFSASGPVRTALEKAGFSVTKEKGFGLKRYMITAVRDGVQTERAVVKTATVIGAGIAGASAARALADGGLDVTVHEKNGAAALGASGNLRAVIYPKMTVDPSPSDAWHQAAFCYVRSLLMHLALHAWTPCGVAHVATDADEQARFEALIARRDPPPGYARLEERNLLQPTAGMIDPAAFCRALLDHPRIRVVYNSDFAPVSAPDHPVILAGGVSVCDDARFSYARLQPVRGQVTLLTATPGSAALDRVLCHDGYLLPAIDGVHVAGATFHKDHRDTECSPEDDAANLASLNKHLPRFGFSTKNIAGARAGVRVTTPDKLPIVGPAPDVEKTVAAWAGLRQGNQPETGAAYHPNVFVLSGLGAHGVTDAPLAGAVIAALVTGAPLPIDAAQLNDILPERFLYRALKRREI